ncbi:hypothetical protein [Desulfoluna sp.]|uniref:hypothetical protein n=1 Tax=Desulfoluna sp. TaxID=2045199 RepID=UPI002630C035|nr:hypothetical protein [Desulfoluna sp.]
MSPIKTKSPSSPLDALFSPERLRKSWRQARPPAVETVLEEAPEETLHSCYSRLQALLLARFSGDEAETLGSLVEDLGALIQQEATKGREAAMHELLNKVEDLVEAYELGGRGNQTK